MIKELFEKPREGNLDENVFSSIWGAIKSGGQGLVYSFNGAKTYYSSEELTKKGLNAEDAISKIVEELDEVGNRYARYIPKDVLISVQRALKVLSERKKIKVIRLFLENVDNDSEKEIVIQLETQSSEWVLTVDKTKTSIFKTNDGTSSGKPVDIPYETKTFGSFGGRVELPTGKIYAEIVNNIK